MAFCPYNWKFDVECSSECALYKNGSCTLREDTSALPSLPPSGTNRINNIYYDPDTDEQVIECSDTPEP